MHFIQNMHISNIFLFFDNPLHLTCIFFTSIAPDVNISIHLMCILYQYNTRYLQTLRLYFVLILHQMSISPYMTIPDEGNLFQTSSACFSPFQPISAYSTLFQSIPANSSLFHPIPAYSSPFQPCPAHSTIFQYISAYSSLFQPISAYFSLFQSIPAYSSLIQPN